MEDLSYKNNIPVFTVSQLAGSIRKTLENNFGRVRLRGEVSGFKKHTSGHLYLSLKDDLALISAVCWKGTAMRLPCLPEDGMEVVVTGRVTTYGGRSQYQIIIENLEHAGQGALLKLLEDRKKKLLAEGLFDLNRKKNLPFLPRIIGVVTSPTGAVFRDILHRIEDRFPCHVVLWPSAVQGEKAQEEIVQAIWGFQGLEPDGVTQASIPFIKKPDLIILARGGGSLEDLWCFNEERVVRAVASCSIPIITAVGHETDTTLVDFAADKRAPTPTGAAEIAVPVRSDILNTILERKNRLTRSSLQKIAVQEKYLDQLKRPLERPARLLEISRQRLDDISEKLPQAGRSLINEAYLKLSSVKQYLQKPTAILEVAALRVGQLVDRLKWETKNIQKEKKQQAQEITAFLRVRLLKKKLHENMQDVENKKRLLDSLSHRSILKRGFSLVTDDKGAVITSKIQAIKNAFINISFHDGQITATPKAEKKRKKVLNSSLPDLFDE